VRQIRRRDAIVDALGPQRVSAHAQQCLPIGVALYTPIKVIVGREEVIAIE
jgi:hypothetical protein